jgi:hypothetical protein
MRKLLALTMVVFVGCFFLGCKEKSPEEKGAEALKKVEVPDAPDKVVTEAVAAVKSGDLIKLYAMLPESYQKDVQGLHGKIAAKMDKEIYDKAFGLLPQALEAVKKNKDKMPVPPEALEMAGGFITLLGDAKINTYDGFKALNVGALLAEHGKALSDFGWKAAAMADKKEVDKVNKMMDGIKAVAKDVKEDTATVEITMGEDMMPVPFVKVEGKWIPKPLADEWKKGIEEAGKEIEEAMGEFEKNKEQVKTMLTGAEEALKKGELPAIPGMGGM